MKSFEIEKFKGKFLKDCPYNKTYEAINRHFIAKIGDEVCKYCKNNKGTKKINERSFIKCNKDEEVN